MAQKSAMYLTRKVLCMSLLSRNEFHKYIKTVKTVVVFISITQVNTSVNITIFQHLGDK